MNERFQIIRDGEVVESRKTKEGAEARAKSLSESYPEYTWKTFDKEKGLYTERFQATSEATLPITSITTVIGKTFTVQTLDNQPRMRPVAQTARYELNNGTLVNLWRGYETNGIAIGWVKRLAKKTSGWPIDVDWYVWEGQLYYKA